MRLFRSIATPIGNASQPTSLQRRLRSKILKMACLFGGVTAWLSLTPIALAQIQSRPIEFLPPPPDQGAPDGRQRGGATRGACLDFQELTALVPKVDGVVWSQTARALPPFFFNIPADLAMDMPLEFVIQDRNDNYAIRQQFSIESAAGLLSLPVTVESTELLIGENYSWTFSIYCDAARPSASVYVSGTVKRVPDPVQGNRNSTPQSSLTPVAQFDFLQQYAAEGLWHEAIELAIALHTSYPANETYAEALDTLMAQAGVMNTSPMEAIPVDVPMETP